MVALPKYFYPIPYFILGVVCTFPPFSPWGSICLSSDLVVKNFSRDPLTSKHSNCIFTGSFEYLTGEIWLPNLPGPRGTQTDCPNLGVLDANTLQRKQLVAPVLTCRVYCWHFLGVLGASTHGHKFGVGNEQLRSWIVGGIFFLFFFVGWVGFILYISPLFLEELVKVDWTCDENACQMPVHWSFAYMFNQ